MSSRNSAQFRAIPAQFPRLGILLLLFCGPFNSISSFTASLCGFFAQPKRVPPQL
jgi:hypothetical protein